MPITKKTREIVYRKFDGHCAYCGCDLKYEDMQVDHYIPVGRNCTDRELERYLPHRGTDDLDNLMPSCRMCNFYKGRDSIEGFRRRLQEWLDYKHTFATKMALKYGILTEHKWDGKFFFEKFRAKSLELENTEYDYGHNVRHTSEE